MDSPDERPNIRGPFDFEEESPISSALRREITDQALLIYKSVFSPDGSAASSVVTSAASSAATSPAASSDSVNHKIRAIFDDIESYDSGQPLLLLDTAEPSRETTASRPAKGSGISRSQTAQGKNLSPQWTPTRAASAKASLYRRKSSRFQLEAAKPTSQGQPASQKQPAFVIPGDRDPSSDSLAEDLGLSMTRSISARSISARIGAIATGEMPRSMTKSRSSQLVHEAIQRSMSDMYISPSGERLTEAQRVERATAAIELIEYKFRKHMNCSEAADGYTCMCTKYCTAKGVLYTERYGRLGNKLFIRHGYYDPGHLVDLFIDAYDEEKRLQDEERIKEQQRYNAGYAKS